MSAEEYDYTFKIVMVGDSDVGKSSILLRYVDDTQVDPITNIGIEFKIKAIEIAGLKIRLQIWDTAGQERYRTLTSSYYRNSHGAFVVYDVTNQQSFDNVKYWLQEINRYPCDGTISILLGNKCDLPNKIVAGTTAKEFADGLDLSSFETSAKNSTNVEEAFIRMTTEILRRRVPSFLEIAQKPAIIPNDSYCVII